MFARSLALGAMMLVGVAGISAAQSTTTPQARPRAGGEFRGTRGPGRDFYADLNLTDAQKTQIKAIREKYKAQNEAARTQAKPFMDAARAARQKGDTVAFRSNIEKARQAGQSVRTQEMAEIRNVLTPDQRTKFDARQKEMAERVGKGGRRHWDKKAPAAKS
jgi:Spy/CpxP family protein refolding chaperone